MNQTFLSVIYFQSFLLLAVVHGSWLRCEPDPDYEAWQVVGGDPQALVVCLPGVGELAVWDSSTPPIPPDEVDAFLAKLTRPLE
jgi:hypothetical protein